MFCSNCGTELNDDANFCSACGTAVANRGNTNALVPVTRAVEEYDSEDDDDYEPDENDVLEASVAYLFGNGVKEDEDFAFESFKVAYEMGNEAAHFWLGLCYAFGFGTKTKKKKAYFHFKQSHKRGEIDGTAGLGYCYILGIGTDEDIGHGLKLMNKALKHGSSLAQQLQPAIQEYLDDYEEECYDNNSYQDEIVGSAIIGGVVGLGIAGLASLFS